MLADPPQSFAHAVARDAAAYRIEFGDEPVHIPPRGMHLRRGANCHRITHQIGRTLRARLSSWEILVV